MRFFSWLRNPEVIGPPGCPLMRRWTVAVATGGKRDEAVLIRLPQWIGFKLLVHHFLPNTEDVDPHDHPRPLWTLILKGGYLDLVPCPECDGLRRFPLAAPGAYVDCARCRCRGVVLGEEMTRGRFRYRPAEHRHVTKVSSAGAWTLCLMGPLKREWGFWRDGQLFDWRSYEHKFGLAFRCESGNRVVEVNRPDGKDAEEAILRPCSNCGLRIPISQLVDRGDGLPVCPSCARDTAKIPVASAGPKNHGVVVKKHAPVGTSSWLADPTTWFRGAQVIADENVPEGGMGYWMRKPMEEEK